MSEAEKAEHPSHGLRISLLGRKGDRFERIDSLALDWCPEESNRRYDLVFDAEDVRHV
ncbi:hypothetical protein PC116_g13927 [Phytophthora cactorum]|nr:hypothetical protein Pcac1_g26549 [Phytophthora cactorum]KAG2990997.1 hypothetical protein PC120_g22805 [Phytophthora cactorum]KAG3008852.1 hypothetical protein PC119_g14095 [Phytophthora cactorum]KAG4238037.1 hypothetical protein PC116_g13927 [Phytophthora cactorum]